MEAAEITINILHNMRICLHNMNNAWSCLFSSLTTAVKARQDWTGLFIKESTQTPRTDHQNDFLSNRKNIFHMHIVFQTEKAFNGTRKAEWLTVLVSHFIPIKQKWRVWICQSIRFSLCPKDFFLFTSIYTPNNWCRDAFSGRCHLDRYGSLLLSSKAIQVSNSYLWWFSTDVCALYVITSLIYNNFIETALVLKHFRNITLTF